MKKEDWLRVAKWMGYVYLPIILLIVIVFILVEWNAYKQRAIVEAAAVMRGEMASTTR